MWKEVISTSNCDWRWRNGFIMEIPNCRVNQVHQRQNAILMFKMWLCVFGGIKKVWCTTSCWNLLKRSQLMKINQALKKKRLEYVKRHEKIVLLNDNARPHITETPTKNILQNMDVEARLLKISKNGSMNGSPQKARISTGVESICCVKHRQRS